MAIAIIARSSSIIPRTSTQCEQANNGRYCQRSIVMPSHFLSYDKIIYLLSITSRNKEVDLNYRSGFLWQHFAILLRFRRKSSWQKLFFVPSLSFFLIHFSSLVVFCLCTQRTTQKEMANDQEMPMKDCLPACLLACLPVIYAERVLSSTAFFDVNLLPVFGIDVAGIQAEHKYHRNSTRTHTQLTQPAQMPSEKKRQFNLCRESSSSRMAVSSERAQRCEKNERSSRWNADCSGNPWPMYTLDEMPSKFKQPSDPSTMLCTSTLWRAYTHTHAHTHRKILIGYKMKHF